MKRPIIVAGLICALATCTALAQSPTTAPTRVNEPGIYACPSHPEILATWPARCPRCQAVLSLVEPSDAAPTEMVQARGRGGDRFRGRTDRFREEARRRGAFRGRYGGFGYRPYGYRPYSYGPYGYYPYGYYYQPRLYFGPPPQGYWYYPDQGYYYSPGTGLYYYPSRGYFYSPRNHRYYSYIPGQGYFYFQIPIG